MAKLSEDVKKFMVEALACYDSPSVVSEAVKEEFGLAVPRQQVELYDPTKNAGKALSKKWRVVFEEARANFKAGVAEVPIASRVFRLRALSRIATKAERMKNMALTLQVLEQAAKEVGDAYVNRRLEPLAPKGGDVPSEPEYVLRPDSEVPDAPIL